MFFSWSIMLAAGCTAKSAALITSTGEGELASVRSVLRVPSTTISLAGSWDAAVPEEAEVSCDAAAWVVINAVAAAASVSAAKAADPDASENANAMDEVIDLIIKSPQLIKALSDTLFLQVRRSAADSSTC
ncbi:hypothetical protein [Sphingomonas prati]|uniref:Uncharacterized protein n=1 Tax=Sphingomonas prati TaxID=1843237 RepID=A0A7W9BT81_9SPHN|nr:hypothetical protein [Sphingomonas prati]MBB5729675.1 hypothetical protein [Sphingomonas prati]GGE90341.1 hypothetical protein GCM10011404_24080 [Sphingomonas prati]